MIKNTRLTSDLAAIGIFAPLVMAARMQMLASEVFAPTRKGRREILAMATEKPFVAIEMAVAMQRSLMESGLKFGRALAGGSAATMSDAPGLALAAAVAPVRKRVRRNARRLRRSGAS